MFLQVITCQVKLFAETILINLNDTSSLPYVSVIVKYEFCFSKKFWQHICCFKCGIKLLMVSPFKWVTIRAVLLEVASFWMVISGPNKISC